MPTAQEIFELLISDPDYQAKNGKSREEVVWEEAQQRERQHRNNNAALSLAWTDTPTLKSFIEYLSKADEGEEKVVKSFVGPLEAIRMAINDHTINEESLPWAGTDRIGTLASLITPHVQALKSILEKNVDSMTTSPEHPAYQSRKNANVRIKGTAPEDTTGEFHPDVFFNMLDQYSRLEQDMRAVGNELHSDRRMLRIGNSDITVDKPVLPRQESGEEYLSSGERRQNTLQIWHNLLNYGRDISQEEEVEGRLEVLKQMEAYLPLNSDLPDPETQLNSLSEAEMVQGMYGNRAIGAKNDQNEDLYNKAAVDHFLEQTGNKLPSNRAFDYTKSALSLIHI